MNHWRDRNDHLRELHEAFLGDDIRLERHVRVGEQHRLALDLLDAGSRSDLLVVDIDAGVLGVGRSPIREQRINRGPSGAGEVGSVSTGYYCHSCSDKDCKNGLLHRISPAVRSKLPRAGH